jgi:hypothetical protein
MFSHSIALRESHHQSRHFFSAPATKTLIRLQARAAFIAKHEFLPKLSLSPAEDTNRVALPFQQYGTA